MKILTSSSPHLVSVLLFYVKIKLNEIFTKSPNCRMHSHILGRFVHVCVEMGLKLESIEYVVFDEADRLFEVCTPFVEN